MTIARNKTIDLDNLFAKVVWHDMLNYDQALLRANDAEGNYFGEGWVTRRETGLSLKEFRRKFAVGTEHKVTRVKIVHLLISYVDGKIPKNPMPTANSLEFIWRN
jgi:hypothetical protein